MLIEDDTDGLYWVLDENGEAIPAPHGMFSAEAFLQSDDKRRVAETLVEGPAGQPNLWVSTVFLTINHNWMMGDTPTLFETLPFIKPKYRSKLGKGLSGNMWRYATRAEALRGHEKMVQMLKGLTPEEWSRLLKEESFLPSPQDD